MLNPASFQQFLIEEMEGAIASKDLEKIEQICNIADLMCIPLFIHQVQVVEATTDDCRDYLEGLLDEE